MCCWTVSLNGCAGSNLTRLNEPSQSIEFLLDVDDSCFGTPDKQKLAPTRKMGCYDPTENKNLREYAKISGSVTKSIARVNAKSKQIHKFSLFYQMFVRKTAENLKKSSFAPNLVQLL